jgi:hypothetical protein
MAWGAYKELLAQNHNDMYRSDSAHEPAIVLARSTK